MIFFVLIVSLSYRIKINREGRFRIKFFEDFKKIFKIFIECFCDVW